MEKRARHKYPLLEEVMDTEHVGMVREIFSTITGRYDFLNHLLSLRRDIAWRRYAVREMRFFHTYRLLDVATGTADLAIDATCRHPRIQVTGVDFVREMMDLGRAKIRKRRLSDRIRLLMGDALDLPFPDSSFDVAAIAFGIRNIPNKMRALREMVRAVVPGGQVMVLEMTVPPHPLFRRVYRAYLTRMLPTVARAFSANPAAYDYLADSIASFPTQEDFAELMEEAGLTRVEKHSLTLGITHVFTGIKPGPSEAVLSRYS